MSPLSPYLSFARARFRRMLAYRVRFFTGIVSYLVYVTTYYYLWRAVYSHRAADADIGGFDLARITTYVAVGWVARSFYFNNVDREIGELVQNGQIALALARPVSFQGTVIAEAFGEGLFRGLFFTVPIGAVIFLLFPVAAPPTLLHGVCFLLSLALALLVLTHINFLVGMCAFSLKSIDGVMRAKHYLLELLSGLLLPVSFFPDWLAEASRWLPFQSISYLPTRVWLGADDLGECARGLAAQALWVALLLLVSAFVWKRIARRLTVQGG
jgi:ABC-2 type transport system permease protein